MQGSTVPDPRVSPGSLALAALLLLGLVLRLIHLGTGLWYDEIQTLVQFARLPIGRLLTEYPSTNHHPLYSQLASASIGLLGESGATLRLPAALMGTASLWAFYRLAMMVTTRREALLGTLLLTLSYHHVWFSQNARGYSGLLLFTLLGTAAFLRLLQDPRAGWPAAAWYGGCMALAAYIHPTAVALPAAYAFSLEALTAYSAHVAILIVAGMVFFHLGTVKPHQTRRFATVCLILALLGSGLTMISNEQRSGHIADEHYMAVLMPPEMRVSPDHSVNDFMADVGALKSRLDEERTKKVKDDGNGDDD